MKEIDPNPAQRQLVHRFISWELVEQRLQRFPAVGRAFPIECLRSRQEDPPYYCHYMAWRLGTWSSDSLFARLDELLSGAEQLRCWSAEAPLLKSAEFSDFWSLVWQLQVAEYLRTMASSVQWASSGPDLSAQVESETWYVECYTYRKSFGLMLFIEEVFCANSMARSAFSTTCACPSACPQTAHVQNSSIARCQTSLTPLMLSALGPRL